MSLATWWQTDSLPLLSPFDAVRVEQAVDRAVLASINNVSQQDVQERWDAGHTPYLAWVRAEPVAYGWVASKTALIGELGLKLSLPEHDRYLWDFATLPQWRGRGVYPLLLQRILQEEVKHATRFWIAYAPENRSSARGIQRAGFVRLGQMSFTSNRAVALKPDGLPQRAAYGASIFGIALAQTPLAACWQCTLAISALVDQTPPRCCFPQGNGYRACPCVA